VNKSLGMDSTILLKMLKNVDDARRVISSRRLSFDSSARNALYNDKEAFDLCSFYLALFGEKTKLLTSATLSELGKVVDIGVMRYFRNKIDHDYESVNRVLLQSYIQVLVSDNMYKTIQNRILYCRKNRKV